MNEELWNEYLQNYYAEMCTRLTGVDTFFPGTWEILPGSFRNPNKDESVEKFIN